MANINTVTVVGNITRDVELTKTTGGTDVCELGVAVNRRWPSKTEPGTWEEKVSFFDVTCWQQLGVNVAGTFSKGQRVLVTGRLEQDRWETPEGDNRSKVRIIADNVAPSLEWATAEITKNPKAGSNGDAGAPAIDEDF